VTTEVEGEHAEAESEQLAHERPPHVKILALVVDEHRPPLLGPGAMAAEYEATGSWKRNGNGLRFQEA
jgi:hypothetical protein